MNGFQDVQPGDCIVAFSRKAIFEIKSFIESTTGLRWVRGPALHHEHDSTAGSCKMAIARPPAHQPRSPVNAQRFGAVASGAQCVL